MRNVQAGIDPCDDAISRQAILDLVVANHTELNGVRVVMYSPLCKDIIQLPSVKQKPICPSHGVDCEDCPAYEPSEDAISREMALKECHDIVIDGERYRVIQEETLLGLPTVNPQKSGKWEILACDLYMCSKCYAKYTFKSNYCPNCGADMRGEQNE